MIYTIVFYNILRVCPDTRTHNIIYTIFSPQITDVLFIQVSLSKKKLNKQSSIDFYPNLRRIFRALYMRNKSFVMVNSGGDGAIVYTIHFFDFYFFTGEGSYLQTDRLVAKFIARLFQTFYNIMRDLTKEHSFFF